MTTARSLALTLAVLTTGCRKGEPPPLAPAAPARVVELTLTEAGFEPAQIKTRKGEQLVLKVTRTTDKTCATEILIDGTQINVPLPLNRPVEVPFTPGQTGEIRYGCAMGMMVSGVLLVE